MRQPISIVIPTYNGKKLLQKNLPSVLASLQKDDELIIVDDHSTDQTLRYLSRKFKLEFSAIGGDEYGDLELYTAQLRSKARIKVIYSLDNLRFAGAVNRAVAQVTHKHFLLINNDVSLKPKTIEKLLANFSQKKNLFAVGCLETEPNQGNIQGGKNKLVFNKGLFSHQRAEEFNSGSTAWASGGSAMINRAKWLKLGGFDSDFYPAYWEDIDLSNRAKEQGWQVWFDQEAEVVHNHESTNQPVFGKSYLDKISWRNADRFTAKHAKGKQKIAFYLYKPFWFWQRLKYSLKTKQGLACVGILLIATFLRFFQLAQVPAGMTWDEAAIGYNGYAVIKTRHDEWLERLPVSFRSFGDYKAPLAIYLVGIFTVLLDLKLWIIRLPFALAGVIAVVGMIKLTAQVLEVTRVKTKLSPDLLSLIAGLMLAVSPWHLHFCRAGFESGLALTLVIWAFYYLTSYLKKAHVVSLQEQFKHLLPAVLLFTASFYTYHSVKIAVPLLVLFFYWLFKKRVVHQFLGLIIAALTGFLLAIPLIKDSLTGDGLARAGTLLFTKANSFSDFVIQVVYRLGVHLSPHFLVGGWTDTLRHGAGRWGVLLPVTFLFFVIGLVLLVRNILVEKTLIISMPGRLSFWLKIAFIWLIIGLLPAILGEEYPQANRALLALPGFFWLALAGLDWVVQTFTIDKLTTKKIIFSFALLYFINVGLYLRYYYQVFPQHGADAFNEGYIEAMQIAYEYERGVNNKPEVDQIIVSNQYGQAYIYALWVRKTNPIWYQGGSLIKYLFVDDVTTTDLNRENTLLIATKYDEIAEIEPDYEVVAKNGEVRFNIYYLE